MVTLNRLSWPGRAGVVGCGLVCGGLTLSAAVLPLSTDGPPEVATGPNAGIFPSAGYGAVAGAWIGHTATGRDVRFDLTFTEAGLSGSASLSDLLPGGSAAFPVTSLSLTERTLVFRLKTTKCPREARYGILTFVSADSARLDLQSENAPVSLLLSKIG